LIKVSALRGYDFPIMWTFLLSLPLVVLAGNSPADPARIAIPGGCYWILLPRNAEPQTRYPLIIAVHDTTTDAEQTVRYWDSVITDEPVIVVAPQSGTAGWQNTETEFIQRFSRDLKESIPFDSSRVLITGHSTGGTLALYMLYEIDLQATAAAVSSATLSDLIRDESIARQKDVPVLWAVKRVDYHGKPCQSAIRRLREAAVRVSTQQFDADRMLDVNSGRRILEWFSSVCYNSVAQRLDRASRMTTKAAFPGPAAAELESILRDQASHEPDQVQRAADLLSRLQSEGGKMLEEARTYLDLGQNETAVKILLEVERRYRPSSLADEARAQRLQISPDEEPTAELPSLP
jgi:hypothetical protein